MGRLSEAGRRILLVDAHPDADPAHFVHALAAAYADAARAAGHEFRPIEQAKLTLLRKPADWNSAPRAPEA